ncbi:hypothetical protein DAPPUDRAFT_334531 [Daphnia pulex]|uniref:Uncharacterized protein n=1 Tax=Daphnia pulex TaxID=6669 RepID=E9HVS9_DAPPU|nr:hypothetical protein DAPPUDRAFT_334531 [Daphnia pulex]|eukprot:EFX64151.1 hypothetical protein DAPPUDRAFT_334531 [Daphnia pulex]
MLVMLDKATSHITVPVPNKRNARNETALHLVCKPSLNVPPSAQDRRLACAHLILQWKGGFSAVSGNIEQADLKALDMHGNIVLHLSAGSGLDRVVELLVSHGAPLFLENSERLTPCDVAMRANFHDITLFLESRMVFAITMKQCTKLMKNKVL